MKAPSLIKERTDVDFADEITRFSLKVGTVICAMIGIWAAACLFVGLAGPGPVEMVKGYITALTGL